MNKSCSSYLKYMSIYGKDDWYLQKIHYFRFFNIKIYFYHSIFYLYLTIANINDIPSNWKININNNNCIIAINALILILSLIKWFEWLQHIKWLQRNNNPHFRIFLWIWFKLIQLLIAFHSIVLIEIDAFYCVNNLIEWILNVEMGWYCWCLHPTFKLH